MRMPSADRLWVIGASVATALLLVIGWFFLISPQNSETTTLREETASAEAQLLTQSRRLAELQAQNLQLDAYKNQLAADRKALPTDSGLPALLRQLQVAGGETNVVVSNIGIGGAAPVEGAANTFQLPITLSAEGKIADLQQFLDRLQRDETRALLIDVLNATADGGTFASKVQMTLTVQAFVAAGS